LQGNIVSKDFLLNTLKYSTSDFRALTEEEKRGGIGADGGKIVPEGAIYLTWYHASSTKVFRDMRFLISPYANYDLIIGARSIEKHNLLSEPNLNIIGFSAKTSPLGKLCIFAHPRFKLSPAVLIGNVRGETRLAQK